jgi:hypothetical protein
MVLKNNQLLIDGLEVLAPQKNYTSDFPVISRGAAMLSRLRIVGATSARIPSFNLRPFSLLTRMIGTGFNE